MADPASAAATAAALPPALQTALAWGLGIGGMCAPVLAYFWPRAAPKAGADDAAAKAITAAVIAPLGDPNQFRQMVEELHKLNDYAFQISSTADDVKDALRDLKDGQRDLRDAINRPR